MSNFEDRIATLDIGLFSKIKSQSSDMDKQSLLACQLATRELVPVYNYLEIGSYLGGSIQPHLLDDKCSRIYSIDKRPDSQPDERAIEYVYQNNSTARMLDNLRSVDEAALAKVSTIDGDTRELTAERIGEKVQLCFVDGEHTNEAVVADFKYCLSVMGGAGAVIFHDAEVTYNGLADCIAHLEQSSISFHAYSLPNIVFVIEVGDFPLHRHPLIMERLIDNHQSYLHSLKAVDYYREFTNKTPFRLIRNFMSRMRGHNVSE